MNDLGHEHVIERKPPRTDRNPPAGPVDRDAALGRELFEALVEIDEIAHHSGGANSAPLSRRPGLRGGIGRNGEKQLLHPVFGGELTSVEDLTFMRYFTVHLHRLLDPRAA